MNAEEQEDSSDEEDAARWKTSYKFKGLRAELEQTVLQMLLPA